MRDTRPGRFPCSVLWGPTKGIVIGKRGAAIRELGSASRVKIEHFLGRRVYLDLWVKPLKSWRKNRAHLRRLGFRLPADDESEKAQ